MIDGLLQLTQACAVAASWLMKRHWQRGGRSSTDTDVRASAYKTVNKRLGLDTPYLWTDRAVWAVIGAPDVQNFNNPTTPQGAPAYGMIGGSVWPTQIWIS